MNTTKPTSKTASAPETRTIPKLGQVQIERNEAWIQLDQVTAQRDEYKALLEKVRLRGHPDGELYKAVTDAITKAEQQ